MSEITNHLGKAFQTYANTLETDHLSPIGSNVLKTTTKSKALLHGTAIALSNLCTLPAQATGLLFGAAGALAGGCVGALTSAEGRRSSAIKQVAKDWGRGSMRVGIAWMSIITLPLIGLGFVITWAATAADQKALPNEKAAQQAFSRSNIIVSSILRASQDAELKSILKKEGVPGNQKKQTQFSEQSSVKYRSKENVKEHVITTRTTDSTRTAKGPVLTGDKESVAEQLKSRGIDYSKSQKDQSLTFAKVTAEIAEMKASGQKIDREKIMQKIELALENSLTAHLVGKKVDEKTKIVLYATIVQGLMSEISEKSKDEKKDLSLEEIVASFIKKNEEKEEKVSLLDLFDMFLCDSKGKASVSFTDLSGTLRVGEEKYEGSKQISEYVKTCINADRLETYNYWIDVVAGTKQGIDYKEHLVLDNLEEGPQKNRIIEADFMLNQINKDIKELKDKKDQLVQKEEIREKLKHVDRGIIRELKIDDFLNKDKNESIAIDEHLLELIGLVPEYCRQRIIKMVAVEINKKTIHEIKNEIKNKMKTDKKELFFQQSLIKGNIYQIDGFLNKIKQDQDLQSILSLPELFHEP